MSRLSITPLGTVSPYCKDNMNCPGFLVEYNDKKILLDCGNGITRFLNFPEDLKNLNVFISHYHKDHFGEIGALQYVSYVYRNLGLLDKKIKVFLPEKDFGFSKKTILANDESYAEYIDIIDSKKYMIGDLEVTFENNKSHSIESFMIKLTNKDFIVVYTSDVGTTNFDGLIEFCKDADLIICESSFLKKHDSKCTTHLTAFDAGKLAKLSKAKKLVLTHFWPQENKNLYLIEAKLNFENSYIAIEGQKIVL